MGGAVPLDASDIVDSLLLRSFSPSSPPRSGNDASKLLRALPRRDEPPGPESLKASQLRENGLEDLLGKVPAGRSAVVEHDQQLYGLVVV